MNSAELISSFADFAKEKNIDRPTMIKVLEDVFRTMIRKRYGTDENFEINFVVCGFCKRKKH